jgi:hypothetical protein
LWTKAQRLLTKASPNQCERRASGRSITRKIGGNRAVATFLEAAVSYHENGGEARFVKPLLDYFKTTPLSQIGQAEVKMYARRLYSGRATSTRQGTVSDVHHHDQTDDLRRAVEILERVAHVLKQHRGVFRLTTMVAVEAVLAPQD